MPARQCSNVDLPEPLGPMTATISPCRTLSEAPRSAGVLAERLHQVPRLDDVPGLAVPPRRGGSRSPAHRPFEQVQPGRGVVDPSQVSLQR